MDLFLSLLSYLCQNLHDGPGLGLPLSVSQPPLHLKHQAGGDLAPDQPRLSCPRYFGQRLAPGERFDEHFTQTKLRN